MYRLSKTVVTTVLFVALLAAMPALADESDWFRAIAEGDIKSIDAAIRSGMSPDTRRRDGALSLEVAIRADRLPVVQRLLEAGADPQAPGLTGEPLIVLAVHIGNPVVIRALMRAGASPTSLTRGGFPVWELALRRDNFEAAAEFATNDDIARRLQQKFEALEAPNRGWSYLAGRLKEAKGEYAQAEFYFGEAAKYMPARYSMIALQIQQKKLNMTLKLLDRWRLDRDVRKKYAYLESRYRRDVSDTLAGFVLAYVAMHGRDHILLDDGTPPNQFIMASAKEGLLVARYLVGRQAGGYAKAYFLDLPEDEATRLSIAWLKEAADAGLADAASELGYCYLKRGDTESAMAWFERAGALGKTSIYSTVAYDIAQGYKGWTKNGTLAIKWYRMGAEKGSLSSIKKLARIYEEGKYGEQPDALKAAEFYQRIGNSDDKIKVLAEIGLDSAVQTNDVPAMKRWLTLLPEDSELLRKALHQAAEHESLDVMQVLLNRGVAVDSIHNN